MASGLFRGEVHAARIDKGFGGVRIGSPGYTAAFTLLLVSSTLISLAYLCTGTYARSVPASGFLLPEQATVRIAADGGAAIVLAVHVGQGSYVETGDALITLGSPVAVDPGREVAAYRSYSARLRSGFADRLLQLDEEVMAQVEQHRLARARLSIELRQNDSELRRLTGGRRLRAERLSLAQSKSRALAALREKRMVAALDWMDHQSLVLRLREELVTLDGEISGVIGQREAGRLRLAEIDVAEQQARLQNAARRSELQLQQDQALVSGERVLLASKPGYVDALDAQPGMAALPGRVLMTIVSRSTELRARLLVPGRAAGLVQPGQTVHLRFDAFPHQHFGTWRARLVSLSRAISAAGETIGPFRSDEPVYLGDALLDSQPSSSTTPPLVLREGMRFVADLELEQRTLMQWLLEPLLRRRGGGA